MPTDASPPSSAASASRSASLVARAAELPRSAWFLVGANVVPLLGVLLLGWDLGPIMVLFWAENVVIGVYTALRMALVARWLALFLVPFFSFHYGMFTLGHGVFVFGVFAPDLGRLEVLGIIVPGAIALVVSHGASFVMNFLRGGERQRMQDALGSLRFRKTGASSWSADVAEGDEVRHAQGFGEVGQLMVDPYRRIVVLHLTIIGGGFLVMFLGEPKAALALLVALKTGVDLRAHLRERARKAPPTTRPEAST